MQLLANGPSECQSILTSVIDVKFPILPDTLDTLLEWDSWPTILPALGNYYYTSLSLDSIFNVAKTSSSQSQTICQSFKLICKEFQKKLVSGDVTADMLLKIKKKWHTHLVQILSALSIDQCQFSKDFKFAEKSVIIFKSFVLLLKEFATSFSQGINRVTFPVTVNFLCNGYSIT